VAVRDQLAGWDERVLGRGGAGLSARNAPGPSPVLSLGVLVLGIVIGLAGGLGAWRGLGPTLFTSPAYTLPALIERHLDAGDYEVYQRTGGRSSVPGFPAVNDVPTTIGPNDVTVVGPGGNLVPVEQGDVAESLTRDRVTYTGTVFFHVTDAGTYRISIRANGGYAEAIVTSTLGDAFRRAAAWLSIAFVGGLVAIAGLVLLIIGATRRHRAVQPGWYADPGGSGRMRWWNGVAWTEHIW
jgi:uncharacterized protein DUF2510